MDGSILLRINIEDLYEHVSNLQFLINKQLKLYKEPCFSKITY